MKAITKFLAGGVAIAALASAAPAAAQYYPGYGPVRLRLPGYGGGNVVGQVINQVLGGGYGGYGYNGYGAAQQPGRGQPVRRRGPGPAAAAAATAATAIAATAITARYGGGRVLGISRVEPRSNGGLTVRGVANSGRYAGAYGYNGQGQVDLTFKCRTDYRGCVTDVDVDRAQSNYGYDNYTPYSNYGNDYSQYGYRRY